ncbi:putative polysaccharide biosynthesis protein [Paenibacillus sacheonensis]|uniref:Oligosaccharide flippase family protein n=1 Tax=Paenibacillus sacheonensis TaxID=742054 RepID=A0A7X4YKE2_9BACL|nr:polysaccharide biosynthesis protein [Paenibacillus sacheonensis]MBM7563743.1 stage V sporulation protein B [Paenibacillus sacheonensis]NBC67902.1 oligosaccharide flippase family protein [Paenibacillus sacheonensis]
MTKQTFIKGALILLAAGIVNRILAFVPRIALPRIIGAEGVGIYQLGYPFLIVLLTLITGGIPLAIAKSIAEAESQGNGSRVKQIFRAAMSLTVILSAVLTVLFVWMTPWISTHLMTDPRVFQTFRMMSPLLLIIGISSVYRGYFQGKHNMIPTALSQTMETIIRIIFALLFAKWLLPYGLEWGAAGAMLGVVAGEVAGFAVLLLQFAVDRKKPPAPIADGSDSHEAEQQLHPAGKKKSYGLTKSEPKRPDTVMRRLINLSVPVTASRMIGSFSYLLESILTARALLVAGIATGAATAQYGALQGMIIPILLLPTALTYSLAVSLVPSLSEAAAKGDRITIHKRLHQSMRLCLVTGAPFVVVMLLFAEPICRVLYDHAEIAPMLKWMAPVGMFIYMQAPLQAALQALDKPATALMNTFIGAVVKLVLIVQLAAMPSLGIYGALIAINVNIVLVTGLHWISVARLTGFRMKGLDFLKVGAAMLVMGAASVWVMNLGALPAMWQNLFSACLAGVIVYLILMVVLRIIDRHDAARLPIIGRWFRT